MKEACIKLENWGCEVKKALSRFIDDEEFYLECIIKFKSETGFEKLGECINEQQYREAYEYAHMLKGVAGNLGLMPLYEQLCILVEYLRKYDNVTELDKINSLYNEIMQRFSEFCELE